MTFKWIKKAVISEKVCFKRPHRNGTKGNMGVRMYEKRGIPFPLAITGRREKGI
jgi:hypothetical protein